MGLLVTMLVLEVMVIFVMVGVLVNIVVGACLFRTFCTATVNTAPVIGIPASSIGFYILTLPFSPTDKCR